MYTREQRHTEVIYYLLLSFPTMIKLHTTPVPGSKHSCAAQVQFQICIQHTHSHIVPVHNLPTFHTECLFTICLHFSTPTNLLRRPTSLGRSPNLIILLRSSASKERLSSRRREMCSRSSWSQGISLVSFSMMLSSACRQRQEWVSQSVSNLVVVFMLSQPVWLCQGEQREERCSHR